MRPFSLYTNESVIALRTYVATNSSLRYELVHFAPDGILLSQVPINADGPVTTFTVQPDGKIIIGGKFQNIGGLARDRIARLTLDGAIDPSFNAGVIPGNPIQPINVIAITADNKVYIGSYDALIRVDSAGARDNSFNLASGSTANVRGVTILPDGKILAFGVYFQDVNHSSPGVALYNADGTLDQQFQSPFGSDFSVVLDIAVDKNGRIVVLEPLRLSRLNTDGSLDATFPISRFGPGPFTPSTQLGFDLLLRPDGNVLVAGRFGSIQGESRSIIASIFGEPLPIPLHESKTPGGIGLTWSNAALSLQSAPDPNGPYVTIPSAKSPWLMPHDSTSAFFRLTSE
jgi:uncharacterized delta-60 repeat protein